MHGNGMGFTACTIDELTHLMCRSFLIHVSQQVTTWIDPRTGKPAPNKDGGRSGGSFVFPSFESPPSPLSLMDVITVGSPIAVDRSGTSAAISITNYPTNDCPFECYGYQILTSVSYVLVRSTGTSSSSAATTVMSPPPPMLRNRRDAEEAAERLLPIGNNTIARYRTRNECCNL